MFPASVRNVCDAVVAMASMVAASKVDEELLIIFVSLI